jgi:four helix bundle protein
MNDNTFAFEDLLVWQKSVDFAEAVILAIDEIDAPRKHYRLIEQIESSAVSVSANIAEGKGRYSVKDFVRFLYIARGSLFESISRVIIAHRLRWIGHEKLSELKAAGEEIAKMLNSLIKSIKL